MDFLPLESNNHPVVYSGTRTTVSPNRVQIPPVMPYENASFPHSLGPTSGEPYCGPGIDQFSRVPEATSRASQNSSGTSRGHNTSSALPSGQGPGAPDISTPPESSRLQAESLEHTRNEGTDQIGGETLLEEVAPERGPMTGRIQVVLFGENFPTVPLYVSFGDNWARAVSYARYHYPF